MKRRTPLPALLLLSVGLGLVLCQACLLPSGGRDTRWTVKPLVVQKGEEPEPADNSFCYVCHVNYQDEKLNAAHTAVGVGCETCHGISDTHSADEDGLTPPDVMWPTHRITRRCMTCHPRNALLAKPKAAEQHKAVLGAASGDVHCALCHAAKHRLRNRTRVWDKETGKLLKQTGGPRMDQR